MGQEEANQYKYIFDMGALLDESVTDFSLPSSVQMETDGRAASIGSCRRIRQSSKAQ